MGVVSLVVPPGKKKEFDRALRREAIFQRLRDDSVMGRRFLQPRDAFRK